MPHVEVNFTESNLETHNFYAPLSDDSETDMDMEPSQTDAIRSIANKRKPENTIISPTPDESTEEDGYQTVKARKKKKKKTNGETLEAKENIELGNNTLAIASNKVHPNQPAPRSESHRAAPPQRIDKIEDLKTNDIEFTEDQLQTDPSLGKRLPKRSFEPSKEMHFDVDNMPSEWDAWLRNRRKDPPTIDELKSNLAIAQMKQENARKLLVKEGKDPDTRVKHSHMSDFPQYQEYELNPGKGTTKFDS